MTGTTSVIVMIATHLLSPCHCLGPATIPTALHGGIGGQPGSSWSTYPVNAILTWVECDSAYFLGAVTELTFSHSDETISPQIGRNDGVSCGAVTLDDDEYINAYNIWTATPPGECVTYTIYVFGFAFRTNKGRELQCGGPDAGCGDHETTGWVTYEGYFMGGVNWRGGSILDAIGFCFVREDLMGVDGLSCDPPPACAEQGLAFNEAQICECKSECVGCSSLETVATRLHEELFDYELCANIAESCCCNCNTTSPTTVPTSIPSTSPTTESVSPTPDSKSPTSESISPTSESKSPTFESISPTLQSASATLQSISPTLESVSPTTESVSPTSDSISPTSNSLSPTLESLSPSSFTSQPTQFPVIVPTKSPSNEPTEAPTNGPTKGRTASISTDDPHADEIKTAIGSGISNTLVFVGGVTVVLFLILFIVIFCVWKNKQRESVSDNDYAQLYDDGKDDTHL